MWGLFNAIVASYLEDKGTIDENISVASVSLVNFMAKAPLEYKSAQINGKTPLQMTLEMVSKIFEQGRGMDDEITSMCAVSLIMALLEHIDGIQEFMHTINQMYISELQQAETGDYKNMIVQGLMMNFFYD